MCQHFKTTWSSVRVSTSRSRGVQYVSALQDHVEFSTCQYFKTTWGSVRVSISRPSGVEMQIHEPADHCSSVLNSFPLETGVRWQKYIRCCVWWHSYCRFTVSIKGENLFLPTLDTFPEFHWRFKEVQNFIQHHLSFWIYRSLRFICFPFQDFRIGSLGDLCQSIKLPFIRLSSTRVFSSFLVLQSTTCRLYQLGRWWQGIFFRKGDAIMLGKGQTACLKTLQSNFYTFRSKVM
jgi:hypothetical protein